MNNTSELVTEFERFVNRTGPPLEKQTQIQVSEPTHLKLFSCPTLHCQVSTANKSKLPMRNVAY